ncbi:MFS transporter [Cupriavidus numazuensis]|uniref:Hexuronate transporter n=1 Tax=Cupriavidus numazuensis TaxID=221992 RepID=A0ABM8TT63_9BURK|nr:MFS transporter [Cupriavidus numazuensis]CAG2159599.1 Hexuronate transporter [Cupriavidus numazuensis]
MDTPYQPLKAWRTALLLVVYMVINFADKIAVGLLAVPMMTELKLSPTDFGLIGSSFFWLFAVAGVAGGFMANRRPATGMLLAMALAWSVLQIPMALSSSILVLVVARVLLGVAEGPAWPVAVHACYKWFPNTKRELPVVCLAQGGAIGLLLAGVVMPLVTAKWGWRANFYGLAVLGLIWALLWTAFGREGKGMESGDTAVPSHLRVPYGRLLAEPTVAACMAMKFFSYWGLALTLTWMPVYLQRGLGFGAVEAGRLYAASIALSMPLSLIGSWLVRQMLARGFSSRNARGRMCAAAVALGGSAYASLWLLDLPPLVRVILIGFTLGVSQITYSVAPAILAEVTPGSQRGAILAIDNSIASVAGALAPLLTGFLVQGMAGAAGYEAGFALCGVLMIAGALVGALAIDPEKAAARVRAHAMRTQDVAGQMPSSLAGR